MAWPDWRIGAALGACAVVGCLGPNPAFDEGGGGTASSGVGTGTATGASSSLGTESASADTSETSGRVTTTQGTGSSGAASTGSETGRQAGSAIFVVGDPTFATTNDGPVADLLEGLGYELIIREAADVVVDEATAADLLVLSSSADETAEGGMFRHIPVPLITWEHLLYGDLGLTGSEEDVDFGVANNTEDVELVGGVGGDETQKVIAPSPGRLAWGVPGAEAWISATLVDDPRATFFGYDQGTNGADGQAMSDRRVAFPYGNSPATPTAAGESMLEAAVTWAAQ